MTLNTTEATAVNTLVSYLLGQRPYPGDQRPDHGQALAAAVVLVDGASRKLGAGWTEQTLRDTWAQSPLASRE